jgi:acetyltransferase-like isoleucine patch superfamily enzyme
MGLSRRIRSLLAGSASRPVFASDDVVVGEHVTFGKNVAFNCKKVRIGDGVIFQDNIRVDVDEFEIGDYGLIYDYCFFPGPGRVAIGHNFWLGQSSIVDGQGGTSIGDNVGVGAHSQLWTHMIFGDVMIGSRFHARKPLVVEDDAWLVGHCLVSPVRVGRGSVSMLGSVITRDTQANHVYAGAPARDVTDKFGPAYEDTSLEQRVSYLEGRLAEFAERQASNDPGEVAQIVTSRDDLDRAQGAATVFDVSTRTYRKRGTRLEYELMRYLLPDAKFTPAADRR